MNAPVEDEKILGIPKEKYIKVTYVLLLISGVFGFISSLFALIGVVLPLSGFVSLLGLAGLVLALLGLFVFRKKFSDLAASHLKYLGFVFLFSIGIALILGKVLVGMGIISTILIVLFNLASLALLIVGYKLYEKNTVVTKDNVVNELKALQSTIQKS